MQSERHQPLPSRNPSSLCGSGAWRSDDRPRRYLSPLRQPAPGCAPQPNKRPSAANLHAPAALDFRSLAENPALRVRVGLRRTAFYLVVERILALVGVGEISIVEDDHRCAKRQTRKEKRDCETVEADAARFACDDLIVLAHDPQRNQHGHERSQRREFIEQIGSQVAKIVDNDQEWNAMPRDVVKQFKECEGFEEEHKGGHEQGEMVRESAKNIEIHQTGKAAAGLRVNLLSRAAIGRACGRQARTRSAQPPYSHPAPQTANRTEQPVLSPELFHSGQKGQAKNRKKNVRGPDARGWGDVSLTSHPRAHNEKQVVRGDDDQRNEGACGSTASARLGAERNGHEGKDTTGHGEGQAAMQFDARFAPAWAALVEEGAERPLRIAQLTRLR